MKAAVHQDTTIPIDIHVTALGKRFNRDWIFRNLDYTFKQSHTYAITGPNGSGKSTLLQVLWGQLPQSKGEVSYQTGQKKIPVDDIFNHLTIATPYMDLIEEFTLREHLHLHFGLKKSRNAWNIDEIMEKTQLKHAADKLISNFSSGMKQRVKLALAFFTEASIIFLDEPTTNLDKAAIAWYHEHLSQLPSNCTIFIASNDSTEYPADSDVINIMDFK